MSGAGSAARSRRAGDSAEASAADLESVRLSAQAALAQAYFQLRTVDAQKQLLDETVAAYEKSLELTQNRYGSGVAGRADVLQARDPAQIHPGPGDRRRGAACTIGARHRAPVGKPASVFSLPAARLTHPACPYPSVCRRSFSSEGPISQRAERRMAAANAQIGVAKAAFFPTVTLSAVGRLSKAAISPSGSRWPSHFWSLGPAMAETLFDGGLREAQTAQARAAYEATVASYRQTVLTGFQEVEDNLAALRILEEEAQVQDEAVKAASNPSTLP